jgi:hypothetical protein
MELRQRGKLVLLLANKGIIMNHNFCLNCNTPLNADALFCPACGTKVSAAAIESRKVETLPADSPKSSQVTLVLCILLGVIGAHRFYVGKRWTGILMMLSCGALGVWVLIDLISIIKNNFEDKEGRTLVLTHNLSPAKEILFIAAATIGWLAMCMASIAAILMYSTTALVTVVNYQLTSLSKGDIELAYSYNSKDFQQNLSLEGFKKYVELHPVLKKNDSYHFYVRKILNNAGLLQGTLTSTDGVQTPIEYQLLNENGSWKIFNIKILAPVNGVTNNPK